MGKFRVLRQICNTQSVLSDDLSCIRLLDSRNHSEKCGLSCAVDPDDAYLITFVDTERCILEDCLFSVYFTDMFYI